MIRTLCLVIAGGVLAAMALAAGAAPPSSLASDSKAFELRTYTAPPGKLEALHTRFREHTNALFVKHGMKIVGFWVPSDKDKADNAWSHAGVSRPRRPQVLGGFQKDPRDRGPQRSEKDGKIVEKASREPPPPTTRR